MRLSTLLPSPSWRIWIARWSSIALAFGGLLFLSGCDLAFWKMHGHQSTIDTEGPVAKSQTELFYVTCWVTLVIFILVGAVLAYATIKFKAHNEAEEDAEPPEQGHGNPIVEVGLIALSVAALVIIAVPTLIAIKYTYDVPGGETREKFDELVKKGEAYEITATGFQWWFKFEYPSEQIVGAGPLLTSNELVIPAGRSVRINLRTMDVIHSFWIPKLAGKVDMIPNRANFLWLKADNPGYYWGQCAEYCGDSHAVMRFRVIALGQKEFYDWLENQSKPARTPSGPTAKAQFAALRTFKQNEYGFSDKWSEHPAKAPLDTWRDMQKVDGGEDIALIAKGRSLFREKTCFTCHTIRGHSADVMVNGALQKAEFLGSAAYPDLTHVGARTTIAAGLLENNREQLQRWIHNPHDVKPGNKMWEKGYVPNHITLTRDDEEALVAYLQSLK